MNRQSKSLVEIWGNECSNNMYSSPWSKMSNIRKEKKAFHSDESSDDLKNQLQELMDSINDSDIVEL